MKRFFVIIVPSLVPSGPIKGAIALANQLVTNERVALVCIKPGPGAAADIHKNVKVVELFKSCNFSFQTLRAYRELLSSYREGGGVHVVSISMCFSADFVNSFCGDLALICSSVRGNLPVNYLMDYGVKGRLLAYFHLFLLRRFKILTAMTDEMSNQISRFTGKRPIVIGNFVDESVLQVYRNLPKLNNSVRFVFVGSLSSRKRPELLIHSIKKLHQWGYMVYLDLIGDGPLMMDLQKLIVDLDLKDYVNLHGQVSEPYPIVRTSSAFVLPSMSEGQSRAALESLFLGTPCVLRNVDGNRHLINNGINGVLFDNDGDLAQAMLDVIKLKVKDNLSLLPRICDQKVQVNRLLKVLN